LGIAEKAQLEAFSGQIASLTKTSGEKLEGIRTESATGAKQLREEVIAARVRSPLRLEEMLGMGYVS